MFVKCSSIQYCVDRMAIYINAYRVIDSYWL